MYTSPEARTQRKYNAYKKLNTLFIELDHADDEVTKSTIKREIRKLAVDEGISKANQHKTDDDLKVLKDRIRKKIQK